MATDTSWGYSGWSSYNWGGLGQDVNVAVSGTYDPNWGAATWGTGPIVQLLQIQIYN